jgi:ketosteroid isomerase-like protein
MDEEQQNPVAVVERLVQATNEHDIDALVACFNDGYINETPAHPGRSFEGAEQVRRNWTQIFGGVPDVHAEVLQMTVEGDTVWTEWETAGTRRDGASLLLRGVIVFRVAAGGIQSARFYLEPVDEGTDDVNAAVERAVGSGEEAGGARAEDRVGMEAS